MGKNYRTLLALHFPASCGAQRGGEDETSSAVSSGFTRMLEKQNTLMLCRAYLCGSNLIFLWYSTRTGILFYSLSTIFKPCTRKLSIGIPIQSYHMFESMPRLIMEHG